MIRGWDRWVVAGSYQGVGGEEGGGYYLLVFFSLVLLLSFVLSCPLFFK